MSAKMRSITDVMRLLQFGDSVLPVGSFSFSNGLESAIQQKAVRDPDTLRQFVQTVLAQAASTDGIAVLEAHRAAASTDMDRIVRADQALFLRKLNEESRTMTVRMGRKLGELAKRVAPAPLSDRWLACIERGETPGTFAVGLALVFQSVALDERDAFAAHQYGLTTMMLGAAVRLMKLDYLDAQAILFDVNAAADSAYRRVATATLEDMAAFAPMADILAAIHVKSHVRMFMN
jgi:urease accessory protein